MAGAYYTERDDKLVRNTLLTAKQVGKMIGRSQQSVIQRRRTLGVKREKISRSSLPHSRPTRELPDGPHMGSRFIERWADREHKQPLPTHPAMKDDAFIRPPTLAQLMAGR